MRPLAALPQVDLEQLLHSIKVTLEDGGTSFLGVAGQPERQQVSQDTALNLGRMAGE